MEIQKHKGRAGRPRSPEIEAVMPEVERMYREGVAVAEIQRLFPVIKTRQTIQYWAVRNGWTRKQAIREASANRIARAAVVSEADQDIVDSDALIADDEEIIEANASMHARVVTEARRDVRRARNIARHLFKQLEATATYNEKGILIQAISFRDRVMHLQRLSETLVRLVNLEYQVSGLSLGTGLPSAPGEDVQSHSPEELAAWEALRQRIKAQAGGGGGSS